MSSTVAPSNDGLTDRAKNVLWKHRAAAVALPEPGVRYLSKPKAAMQAPVDRDDLADPPKPLQPVFRFMIEAGVVHSVDTIKIYRECNDEKWSNTLRVYQTDEDAFSHVRERVEPKKPWPRCEHTGFRNLGDGYGCRSDRCGEVYGEEAAKAALGVMGA